MGQHEDDVKSLCVNSHEAFTTSVERLDEYVRDDLRTYERQVAETQRSIDAKMARRSSFLRREIAARAAAKASRQAADQIINNILK